MHKYTDFVFKHKKRARLGLQARNPLSLFLSQAHSETLRTLGSPDLGAPWGPGSAGRHVQPPPRVQNHCKRREGRRRGTGRTHKSQVQRTRQMPCKAPPSSPGQRSQARDPHHGSGKTSRGDFKVSDQIHDREGGQFPEGNRCSHSLPGAGPTGDPRATRHEIHRPPAASRSR